LPKYADVKGVTVTLSAGRMVTGAFAAYVSSVSPYALTLYVIEASPRLSFLNPSAVAEPVERIFKVPALPIPDADVPTSSLLVTVDIAVEEVALKESATT
jgi:hypothetical protein